MDPGVRMPTRYELNDRNAVPHRPLDPTLIENDGAGREGDSAALLQNEGRITKGRIPRCGW